MKQLKNNILEQWLNVEFTSAAYKMGLINADRVVSYDETLIYKSIRCLDYESIMVASPDVNYIITVIGLMWEHINFEEYDLRKIIVKFLSRIGYPTSAIICDENFDRATCEFTVLDSYIDEITATINQLNNEVNIGSRKYLLTNFQKKIWDSMDNDKILGISAPTSAGKSFVILLKIVNRLRAENIDIIYIVPTLSLLNQVIPSLYRNGRSRSIMVSLGLDWANGMKLYDIFNNDRYKGDSGAEKIDETIELLQQTISFNIPLLLKPIYDIKNPESCFLVCMQLGAINNIARSMIEMGIPRETSLYLFEKIFLDFKENEKSELSEENIREIIKQHYDNLPFWIQVQLNFIK